MEVLGRLGPHFLLLFPTFSQLKVFLESSIVHYSSQSRMSVPEESSPNER